MNNISPVHNTQKMVLNTDSMRWGVSRFIIDDETTILSVCESMLATCNSKLNRASGAGNCVDPPSATMSKQQAIARQSIGWSLRNDTT